jgi:hypothetical protein
VTWPKSRAGQRRPWSRCAVRPVGRDVVADSKLLHHPGNAPRGATSRVSDRGLRPPTPEFRCPSVVLNAYSRAAVTAELFSLADSIPSLCVCASRARTARLVNAGPPVPRPGRSPDSCRRYHLRECRHQAPVMVVYVTNRLTLSSLRVGGVARTRAPSVNTAGVTSLQSNAAGDPRHVADRVDLLLRSMSSWRNRVN